MLNFPSTSRHVSLAIIAATLALTTLPLSQHRQAFADELPAPTGEVLLVVKGDIEITNVGAEARFDRAMLEQFGFEQVRTRTPWHEKKALFEGVPAARIVEAVGARGDSLLATAANDYHVSIPIADLAAFNVLLAMRIDGVDLTLRTKGPIWVIYPDGADLPPQVRAERMIWQLVELDVR